MEHSNSSVNISDNSDDRCSSTSEEVAEITKNMETLRGVGENDCESDLSGRSMKHLFSSYYSSDESVSDLEDDGNVKLQARFICTEYEIFDSEADKSMLQRRTEMASNQSHDLTVITNLNRNENKDLAVVVKTSSKKDDKENVALELP